MSKHSTLLYWIDDFDLPESSINNPVIVDEQIDDKFLNTLLKSLVYDPGEDLVNKVLMKV